MAVELRRPSADLTACSDRELIAGTRTGDSEAFAELYRRHEGVALSRARQLVRSASDSEDIVAEAFVKILDLLLRGGGPVDDFRPYLLTCVRHGSVDRGRRSRTVAVDPAEMRDSAAANPAEFTDGVENAMTLKTAIASVPSRWQSILWRMEVEDRSIGDVSKELALSPGAVASLSYRARKALSAAYLDVHQPAAPQPL